MSSMATWQKVKWNFPIRLRVKRQVVVNGRVRWRPVRGVVPDEVALGNVPVMSERRER